MKQQRRLFDAIGDLPQAQIHEAEAHRFHPGRWKRYTALAAAAVLAVGLGAVALRSLGGAASTEPAEKASGGGGDGGSYMAYYGPVFPLLSLNGAQGVTAEREVGYDFSPDREAIVTDRYVLTNEADGDLTLELAYPFAGGFSDPERYLPAITVDGEPAEAGLLAGPYAGGFYGVASPGADDTERWNLAQPTSWLDYKALIEGGYLERALEEFPALDQPLTVYKFSDYIVPETDAVNVALNVRFYLPEGAKVISCNSNGGTMNEPGDYQQRHIGGLNNRYRPPQPMYLAVLGGDISDISTEGVFYDGETEGSIDVTAAMTRYETTLGEFLQTLIDTTDGHGWYAHQQEAEIYDHLPEGVFLGCVAQMIESYGFLSDDPAERYDHGMLEDFLGETRTVQRLMYRTFRVSIPAHGSVEVTASARKHGSFDYIGENAGREGYELVTQLGSDLTFTRQTASVSGTEDVELGYNTFGFDLEAGVTSVTLDPEQEYYLMEITGKQSE